MSSNLFDLIRFAYEAEGSSTQKHVLLVLAIAANEHGVSWPSQKTIAERTGLTDRAVRSAIAYWVDAGVLDVDGRYEVHAKYGNRRVSNVYTLTPNRNEVPLGQEERGSGANRNVVPGKESPATSHQEEQGETSSLPRRRPSSRGKAAAAKAEEERRVGDLQGDVHRQLTPPSEPEPEYVPDAGKPKPPRKTDPDSAMGLAIYYRDKVIASAKTQRMSQTNLRALAKTFAEARRIGTTPDLCRKMVDAFVSDHDLMERSPGARWRVFIANAETLRQRAVKATPRRERGSGESVTGHLSESLLKALAEMEEEQ